MHDIYMIFSMLLVIGTFRDNNLVENQTNLTETFNKFESAELMELASNNSVNL